MRSLFRDLFMLLVGFVVIAAVALGFATADASEKAEAPLVEAPAQVLVANTEAPAVTLAPATTTTTTAPAPRPVAKPVVAKAATASKPVAVAAAPADDVEIGTACTMTRNADGSITSEGC